MLLTVNLTSVSSPIVNLINAAFAPALAIVGAIGVIYCILLGVKYAQASEPQEHEKAKNHLKNAIIGFVLIFVLIVALKIGTGVLTQWAEDATSTAVVGLFTRI